MDGSALLESKYWHNDFGEELMSELLDETAAAPVHITEGNQGEEEEEGTLRRRESMVNKLISTVYSGPTISDIESALSFTGGDQLVVDARKYNSSPVVFSPEKVLSKMENKYTLKIKTSGNGLAEDGYKWRKYGQKSIKNSPNPRSYYRCTNPRCNAKKQVERATDEPDTLVVTYEGLHLHYTYSHFLHQQQHHHQQGAAGGGGSLLSSSSSNSSLPKKPKLHTRGAPPTISPDHHNIIHSSPTSMLDLDGPSALLITTQDEMSPLDTAGAAAMAPPPPTIASQVVVPAAAAADSSSSSERVVLPAASSACCYFDDGLLVFQQVQENFQHHEVVVEEQQQQQMVGASNGLLEDVVPLLVRRPCSSGATTTSTSSSPPSPSTSSVSWTPTSPYIDMAILSNIF